MARRRRLPDARRPRAASGGLSTVNGLTMHVLQVAVHGRRPTGVVTTNSGAARVDGPDPRRLCSATHSPRPTSVRTSPAPASLANTTIANITEHDARRLWANAGNSAASRTITPKRSRLSARSIHVGPLSTLLDPSISDAARSRRTMPYTNWGETNRSNMFTPIDAEPVLLTRDPSRRRSTTVGPLPERAADRQVFIEALFESPPDPRPAPALQAAAPRTVIRWSSPTHGSTTTP